MECVSQTNININNSISKGVVLVKPVIARVTCNWSITHVTEDSTSKEFLHKKYIGGKWMLWITHLQSLAVEANYVMWECNDEIWQSISSTVTWNWDFSAVRRLDNIEKHKIPDLTYFSKNYSKLILKSMKVWREMKKKNFRKLIRNLVLF